MNADIQQQVDWPDWLRRWDAQQVGYVPENEVLRVDISTGKPTQLVSAAPEFVVDMSYSRDGKKVALVRGRNTSNAVMLAPAPAK